MAWSVEFADPLVDVRDVVESYRCCGIAPSGWPEVLDRAVATLRKLSQKFDVDGSLPGLVPNLRTMLIEGLAYDPRVLDEVAAQVANALRQVEIPGMPRPDEDYWGFRN